MFITNLVMIESYYMSTEMPINDQYCDGNGRLMVRKYSLLN